MKSILHQIINKVLLRGRSSGFSLVEVMVSGVLVAFSAAAVISVVSSGARLQVTDNDRRQARTLIKSEFEEHYDFRDYSTIVSNITQTEAVVIDEREGNQLQGTLTRRVKDTSVTTSSGTTLPAINVVITCAWNTDPQSADSLTMSKIVAQAQR